MAVVPHVAKLACNAARMDTCTASQLFPSQDRSHSIEVRAQTFSGLMCAKIHRA